MRRAAVVVIAAWLACAAMIGTQGHAFALGCANPTTVQGTSGGVAFPGGLRVNADDWTGAGSTVVKVCSPSDWTATVNQRGAPATGVKTYPDSERRFTDWSTCASQPRVDSFTELTSSYGMQLPNAGSWDAGYDLFLNGGPCHLPTIELMVLTSWRAVDFPTPSETVAIGGERYDVTRGTNFVQLRAQRQTTRGRVNLLAVLRRFAQPTDTVQFVQYGVEVLTTRGHDIDFTLDRFAVTTT